MLSRRPIIYLLGNNADLEARPCDSDSLRMEDGHDTRHVRVREVPHAEAQAFAKENNLLFHECSAKTGDWVEEAFLETSYAVYEATQTRNDWVTVPTSPPSQVVQLQENSSAGRTRMWCRWC